MTYGAAGLLTETEVQPPGGGPNEVTADAYNADGELASVTEPDPDGPTGPQTASQSHNPGTPY
jgi:hypothetical protein